MTDQPRRRRLKMNLSEAQNHRCCFCGKRMDECGPLKDRPTFEHIIPRSRRGSSHAANLAISCLECNQRRGHSPGLTVEEFMETVIAVRKPQATRAVVAFTHHGPRTMEVVSRRRGITVYRDPDKEPTRLG